jgi:flagellar biosynthesis/type III secretory pathway protein FliH
MHFYFDNDQLVRVTEDGKQRTFFFTLPVQPVSGPPVVKKGQKRNATIGTMYNFAKKRQRTEELEEKSTENVSTRVSKKGVEEGVEAGVEEGVDEGVEEGTDEIGVVVKNTGVIVACFH